MKKHRLVFLLPLALFVLICAGLPAAAFAESAQGHILFCTKIKSVAAGDDEAINPATTLKGDKGIYAVFVFNEPLGKVYGGGKCVYEITSPNGEVESSKYSHSQLILSQKAFGMRISSSTLKTPGVYTVTAKSMSGRTLATGKVNITSTR